MKCTQKQIKIVRDWAQAKGIKIGIRKNYTDYFFVSKSGDKIIKEIQIQKRPLNPQLELFYLLHEVGHLITFENQQQWRQENLRYTVDFSVDENVEDSTDWYMVSTVVEEHDAWRNGKILARQLNLNLDEAAYEIEWTDAIKDYIMYAAQKMGNNMKETKIYF
jgi:hypothetical protein